MSVERATENPVASGLSGVTEETIAFASGVGENAVTLLGTLARPEDSAATCSLGVVTLHGWGGTRCGPHRMMVRIGRTLAQRGIPALRFDFSGRGESEGEAGAVTLDDMIRDAVSAAETLREQTGCERIAYCGICSGGNVAMGAHTLYPGSALALISTLPFSKRSAQSAFRKTIARLKEYGRRACKISTWKRLLRGEINMRGVGQTLVASGMESSASRKRKDSRRDIMKALAKACPPCLFVYGAADPEAADAWEHYRSFMDQHSFPATYVSVEGANHNFYAARWSRTVEEAVVAHLAPR